MIIHFFNYHYAFTPSLIGIVGFNYATFIRNSDNNFADYYAGVIWGTWKLDVTYDPKYSGFDEKMLYAKLSKSLYLSPTTYLLGHVGEIVFSDNFLAQSSNYQDYRVGLGFNLEGLNTEIAYTNTLNHRLFFDNKISDKDAAVTISISKTFGLITDKK